MPSPLLLLSLHFRLRFYSKSPPPPRAPIKFVFSPLKTPFQNLLISRPGDPLAFIFPALKLCANLSTTLFFSLFLVTNAADLRLLTFPNLKYFSPLVLSIVKAL